MARATKPLDAGTGRLCASFDVTTAGWLSLGAPHLGHGFVEAVAGPPFDERLRGDADATRRHRLAMTLGDHPFVSVEIDGERPTLDADPSDPGRPRWSGPGLSVEVEAEDEAAVIRQRWVTRSGSRPTVRILVGGRVDRPALAEITELVPPTATGAGTSVAIDHGHARLAADALPAAATVAVRGCEVRWQIVELGAVGTLTWPAGEGPAGFTIDATIEPLPPAPRPAGRRRAGDPTDRLTDRGLAYVRGCTALRLGEDERVILTDHRILPLSWTRDAYWQALALLAADGPGDRMRVADHLRWLWRRCERPDGRWVRSHHANGLRKDPAFQADQQLYPVVELADYWRLTGTLPDGIDWSAAVTGAWAAALEEVDPTTGLIATDENAADDPSPAPFIGSTQILLWYAARRLVQVATDAGLSIDIAAVRSAAAHVRRGFGAFRTGGGPWPYAIDGHGSRVAYHDANDLPIVLAPLWGFCDAADEDWRATMAFAFSAGNPGWVPGSRSGLGSAHTRGAWTLGDVQRWTLARIAGDASGGEAALARLDEVRFEDGMLPEAYGGDGDDAIRHWFAWPGAALAALRVLDRRGLLRDRLSVRDTG